MKITDLSKSNNGKWYEVVTLCTNDPNEKPEIIAKFLHISYARIFVEHMPKFGIIEIIIR